MVQLPKTLKVGPYVCQVSRDVGRLQELEIPCTGAWIAAESLLVVSPKLCKTEAILTLLHEVTHIYINALGGLVGLDDEDTCNRVAAMIYQLLQDNPSLKKLV